MAYCQDLILRQAAAYFSAGDYRQAKLIYERAAQRYGHTLFARCIELCDRRQQSGPISTPDGAQPLAMEQPAARLGPDAQTMALQLSRTQALLEKYHSRCLELEHQLLDVRGV